MAVPSINSSPNSDVLAPVAFKKPPATTTPLEKKVQELVKDALEKRNPKNKTCKEFAARIWNSFCKIIKKIFDCLCDFFCFCCSKDYSSEDYVDYKSEDDISDDLSLSDPLEEVEDFFQEIYKGKIPSMVDLKLTQLGLKKTKDNLNLEKMMQYRQERLERLQANAQEIGSDLSSRKVPSTFEVKGQANIGNSCYMNSVLQCLESTYGVDQEECFQLISQDLSLQKGETLEGLEDRLLNVWAKIPVISEHEKTDLSLKLLEKKGEYGEIKEKSSDGLKQCKKEILFLQKSLKNREDRILFKWSYLLLLQAKLKGNSETIKKALHLHRDICFELALHDEFKKRPYEQKDAASYRLYWNDMLGMEGCQVAMQRVSHFEGKDISTSIKVDPESLIQIPLTNAGSLIDLMEKRFLEKKTADDGEKCTFELQGKREVSLTSYNVISGISCAPPKLITFHFKRFTTRLENNRFVKEKITDPLPIDLNRDLGELDFSPFFRKSALKNHSAIYELKSFVVHLHWGKSIDTGHYVSYTKRDGQWYYCSDSTKNPIAAKDLPLKDAYMMDFSRVKKSG
jgi:ubiquitin C-terminal hydrolase